MKTKLIHVTLAPGRIAALSRKAKRKRIPFDRAVQLAVAEFLGRADKREK